MRKQYTHTDAGLATENSVRAVITHDLDHSSTSSIGTVHKRPNLRGDYNALADYLSQKLPHKSIEHDRLRINIYDLIKLETSLTEAIPPETRLALRQVINDMGECKKQGLTDARLILWQKNGYTSFHMDGVNRVLCAYNEPATQALVKQPGSIQKNIARFGNFFRKETHIGIDPLAFKAHFSFSAGDIWKQGGKEQGATPLWHRGHDAKEHPRLLLIANEPTH